MNQNTTIQDYLYKYNRSSIKGDENREPKYNDKPVEIKYNRSSIKGDENLLCS